MNYKLEFYTQYHQFYICDKESTGDTGDVSFWTDAASNSRLAIGEGILGVSTECYGPVKGELSVLDSKNEQIDYERYDHIVEGGLQLMSGILQVQDCPTSSVELEVQVAPGTYRVRIYSINLASVEGDDGDDYYVVELWPDADLTRTVLKHYQ